jgi:hypothetical protein
MTNKVYKSAQGKPIDLGALILQNEKVRAVGNMNVNARGDILDGANKVILQKNKQVQKQYQNKTNVSADRAIHNSNTTARKASADSKKTQVTDTNLSGDINTDEIFQDMSAVPTVMPTPDTEPLQQPPKQTVPQGGLAGAIARSKLIKQEKEKTLRQLQQQNGLKKI